MNLSLFTDSELPKLFPQIIVDHQLTKKDCYLFHSKPIIRISRHTLLSQIVKIVAKEVIVAYNVVKIELVMNDLSQPEVVEIFVGIVIRSIDFILYER